MTYFIWNYLISSLEHFYYYGFAYIYCKRTTFTMKINLIGFELLNNNVLKCVYSLVNINLGSWYLKIISFTTGIKHSYTYDNNCVILPQFTGASCNICSYINKWYISFDLTWFRVKETIIIKDFLVSIKTVQPLWW
jgi:hypothetical protein